MSWNFHVLDTSADTFEADVVEAIAAAETPLHFQAEDDYFLAACIAAQALMDSGGVGPDTARYRVNLFGHANANHEAVEGATVNDTIGVQVSQL